MIYLAKRHMRKCQKPEKLVKVSDEIHKLRRYPYILTKEKIPHCLKMMFLYFDIFICKLSLVF